MTPETVDWVSAGTLAAALAAVGVVGGALKWLKSQLDRRDDVRRAEQSRLDQLHRDDREYWVERLGVKEMEADHRLALFTLERAHRKQLDEMRQAFDDKADEIWGRCRAEIEDRDRRDRERGLRHRLWDDNVRRDLVALGGRDPGAPPPMYDSDDQVEDPPSARKPDLPRRRIGDPPLDPSAGP